MKLEIHPVALAKLGLLTRNRAKRYLGLTGFFNALEIEQLIETAGCVDSHEAWTPYNLNVCSPFLIYEGVEA